MKLAIVGTGDMGKVLRQYAEEEGTFDTIFFIEPTDENTWPSEKPDLLIDFSHPEAINSIYDFARKQGASLIAITDGPLSPLHSTADICLMAKSDMSSFVDSFAAPLSLINALIVALGQRRRTEVSEYFNKMEKIWAEYDVYLARNAELNEGKK